MRIYLISFLMCFTTLNIFAQFIPSGCGSLIQGGGSTTFINNTSQKDFTFDKRYIACDDVADTAYNGFDFKAQYSVSNLGGYQRLFDLSIGDNSLIAFGFEGNKIAIWRDVIYRPCNTWNNGQCTSFGTPAKGNMTFNTWDDLFLEFNTGWIWVTVTDNMMKIRVSNDENGPYKTEYNYEGLHLSGVDQELADNQTANLKVSIPASSSSGIFLSNIAFAAGHFGLNPPVKIDDDAKSPETNFPDSGSGNLLIGANKNELNKMSEENIVSNLILYPNPTKDGAFALEFALEKEGPVNLDITNVSGQLVFSQKRKQVSKGNHSIQFKKGDVNLPAGVYIVNVSTNEFSKALKLVVN